MSRSFLAMFERPWIRKSNNVGRSMRVHPGNRSIDLWVLFDDCEMATDEGPARIEIETEFPAPVHAYCRDLLECRGVPNYRKAGSLNVMAARFGKLRGTLDSLDAREPEVRRLLDEARSALAEGAIVQVESLLNQASDQEVRAARADPDGASRLFTAAEAKAANGVLKNAELSFTEAVRYFAEAVALLPAGCDITLARYLEQQAFALEQDGRASDAERLQTRARSIRKQLLGTTGRDFEQTPG